MISSSNGAIAPVANMRSLPLIQVPSFSTDREISRGIPVLRVRGPPYAGLCRLFLQIGIYRLTRYAEHVAKFGKCLMIHLPTVNGAMAP